MQVGIVSLFGNRFDHPRSSLPYLGRYGKVERKRFSRNRQKAKTMRYFNTSFMNMMKDKILTCYPHKLHFVT